MRPDVVEALLSRDAQVGKLAGSGSTFRTAGQPGCRPPSFDDGATRCRYFLQHSRPLRQYRRAPRSRRVVRDGPAPGEQRRARFRSLPCSKATRSRQCTVSTVLGFPPLREIVRRERGDSNTIAVPGSRLRDPGRSDEELQNVTSTQQNARKIGRIRSSMQAEGVWLLRT